MQSKEIAFCCCHAVPSVPKHAYIFATYTDVGVTLLARA